MVTVFVSLSLKLVIWDCGNIVVFYCFEENVLPYF